MKTIIRLILLSCFCSFYGPVLAQSNSSHFYCYLNNEYSKDSFTLKEVEHSGKLFQILVTNKKSGKLLEEYLRNDDSSYMFLSYDSLGEITNQGVLKQSTEARKCYNTQIPDILNDWDGTKGLIKDTIVCELYFKKQGIWEEADELGYHWKGTYEAGLKEGIWHLGSRHLRCLSTAGNYSDSYAYFEDETDSHEFKSGIAISKSIGRVWPSIQGKWNYSLIHANDTNLYHFNRFWVYRSKGFKASLPLDFISSSKVLLLCKSEIPAEQSEGKKCNWKQEDNKIYIDFCGEKMVFEIVELTSYMMILKKLHE